MTQITIPNQAIEVTYAVVAPSTGPFTVPFSFLKQEDVFATVTDILGVETPLVLTTDFTFTQLDEPVGNEGAGYTGGAITLLVSIGADGGSSIRIYRSTIIDRTANFPTSGPFNMAILNDELNDHVAIMQELSAENQVSLGSLQGVTENGSTTDVGIDLTTGAKLILRDPEDSATVEMYVDNDGDWLFIDLAGIGDIGSNGGIRISSTPEAGPNRFEILDFGNILFRSNRPTGSILVIGEDPIGGQIRGDGCNATINFYAQNGPAFQLAFLTNRSDVFWLNAGLQRMQINAGNLGTKELELNVTCIKLFEGAPVADELTYGQIWINPVGNTLNYQNEAGVNIVLGAGGAATQIEDGAANPAMVAQGLGIVAMRSVGNLEAEDRSIEWQHQDGTTQFSIGSEFFTDMILRNHITGRHVIINVGIGPGNRIRAHFDGDQTTGGVTLYAGTSAVGKLATAVEGVRIQGGTLFLAEQAAQEANDAGFGQLFVDSADDSLHYITEAGVDLNLSAAAAPTSGSFTIDFDIGTSDSNVVTIIWQRTGDVVHITMPAANFGNADATTLGTGPDWPAGLRPASTRYGATMVTENSAEQVWANFFLDSSGNMTFQAPNAGDAGDYGGSNFSAAGVKGVNAGWSWTYRITDS